MLSVFEKNSFGGRNNGRRERRGAQRSQRTAKTSGAIDDMAVEVVKGRQPTLCDETAKDGPPRFNPDSRFVRGRWEAVRWAGLMV